MAAILTLLLVVTVSLIVNRIATVALTFTGLSREAARFQARSAFSSTGFTSSESELIVKHPVRRRIIMLLMLLGNAGLVTMIATLMISFVGFGQSTAPAVSYQLPPLQVIGPEGEPVPGFRVAPLTEVEAPEEEVGWYDYIFGVTPVHKMTVRIGVLLLGLGFLWLLASSKYLDDQMFKLISWALRNFTTLDTRDYGGLLHLSEGYTVSELSVDEDHWVTGRNLAELRLNEEGINVLGIMRANSSFVATPTGHTYVRNGDTLILYGKAKTLADLDHRKNDKEGQAAHEEAVLKQRHAREGTAESDRESSE